MKASPTGSQIAFLLLALAFGAMLATTWLASVLAVPGAYYSTLGHFVVIPFQFALVLGMPALRSLVLEGFGQPFPLQHRFEALALACAKVVLTFGLWGAVALWGLHISHRSSDITAYGFLIDPAAMDEHYFAAWGLVGAAYAVSLGPLIEEVLYRGVLYRLWERQWGWITATLLSSIVFSLVHPHNLIQTFFSGILYACLLHRTGSLWATTLCHATYNFLVSWPLLGHVLLLKAPDASTDLTPWIANLICLALGSIALALYVGLTLRTPERR
jgi:membrane protease YdiL (CAAX protease family)